MILRIAERTQNDAIPISNCELFVPSLRHSFQRSPRMPATGYRNRDTGILASVGTHIGFWSSSTDASASAFATYLRYWSGELGPIFGHSRANALSVRCVQHLQADFFRPAPLGRLLQLRPATADLRKRRKLFDKCRIHGESGIFVTVSKARGDGTVRTESKNRPREEPNGRTGKPPLLKNLQNPPIPPIFGQTPQKTHPSWRRIPTAM